KRDHLLGVLAHAPGPEHAGRHVDSNLDRAAEFAGPFRLRITRARFVGANLLHVEREAVLGLGDELEEFAGVFGCSGVCGHGFMGTMSSCIWGATCSGYWAIVEGRFLSSADRPGNGSPSSPAVMPTISILARNSASIRSALCEVGALVRADGSA